MAVQVLEKGLNCQNCDEALKKERGCKDKGTIPFYIDNKPHFKCPIRLVTNVSWEYIRAYNFYKNNILPNGNGWINEAEKYLEAMIIVDSEIAKLNKSKSHKGRKPHAGS